MLCNHKGCGQEAITFHGVSTVTHGYCAMHRCCAKCGSTINECKCKDGHTERKEFVEWLMLLADERICSFPKNVPKFGKFKPYTYYRPY